MINIIAVGGYDEVGRNMTAVEVDGEVVVFDCGLHLDNYIPLQEDDSMVMISSKKLVEANACPDIRTIEDIKKKVVGLVPTHAHLDHVGAIPFLESKWDAPIIMTPYTAAVLKQLIKDNHESRTIRNKMVTMPMGGKYKLSENLTLEFVNATHSTPDTAMAALHTPYGVVLYANDFKLDSNPVIGKKTDMTRLKQLSESGKGIICLITDSTYADVAQKTPSESIVTQMLKDVMLEVDNEHSGIIITTFSSHIARLKTIVEVSRKLDRKIVMLGRSLIRYVDAAKDCGIIDFSNQVAMRKFPREVEKTLRKIMKEGKDKYVIICTGHQGERSAVLSKIVDGKMDYKLDAHDHVIFSCKVIPSAMSIQQRGVLDDKLKSRGVRLFTDVHVSGHAAKEDLRELVEWIRPKHIVPAHGDIAKRVAFAELAKEIGYSLKEDVHLLHNGERVEIE